MRTTPVLRALAAGLGLTLALAACSTTTADPAPIASTPAADALTITDPWVKAADEGMTAAFGTLENSSTEDIRIVSASSDAAGSMELHEMAAGDDGAMVMREKEGGVVVEAGSSHELAPGGDHLMLMDIGAPIQPGDEVTVVLTAEDGSTFEFTASARSFSGAEEDYDGGEEMGMSTDDATEGAATGHMATENGDS